MTRAPAAGRVWPAGAWCALVLGAYAVSFTLPIAGVSLAALAAALSIFLASWLAGRAALRMICDRPSSQRPLDMDLSTPVVATGLGLLIMALGSFLLGAVGLWTAGWAWGLVAVVGLGGALAGRRGDDSGVAVNLEAWLVPRPGVEMLALGLAAAALAPALLAALAPPTAFDALVYHLAVPDRWIARGRMVDLPFNQYARQSLNLHVLYTLGMLMANDRVPALMHWGCGVLAGAGVWAAGRRLGSSFAGAVAAATLMTTPKISALAGQPMTDLAVMALGLCAFLAWLNWRDEGRPAWMGVAGALVAGAGCVKYHGFFMLPVLLAATVVYARGWGREGMARIPAVAGAVGTGLAGAALVILPWAIRAVAWRTAGAGVIEMTMGYTLPGQAAVASAPWMGWRGLARLPWDLTMDEARFGGGLLGPLWLMAAPIFLIRWGDWPRPARWLAAYVVVYVAGWVALPIGKQSIRFLLPALPAAALAGGLLFETLAPGWTRRTVCGLWLGAVALGLAYGLVRYERYVDALPVVCGAVTEERYLAPRVAGYDLMRQVGRLPADGTLFMTGADHAYYTHRDTGTSLTAPRMAAELGVTGAGMQPEMVLPGVYRLRGPA